MSDKTHEYWPHVQDERPRLVCKKEGCIGALKIIKTERITPELRYIFRECKLCGLRITYIDTGATVR